MLILQAYANKVKQQLQGARQIYPEIRLRRLRQASWIRDLVQENHITTNDLILPMFITDGDAVRQTISALPGVERLSIDEALKDIARAIDLGIKAFALFPVIPPEEKDEQGSQALNADNLACRALRTIKQAYPNIGLIADVALDPYTSHGHDGVLNAHGHIDNDASIEILAQQALCLAQAGADIVAPSDMMDGRIGAIRTTLESHDQKNTLILSYAAKYASGFYGPFRDALGSNAALKGDKRTYQMNPANAQEALREIEYDLDEGADMIMVKPGLPYLDIIARAKDHFDTPLLAYHVSGEFAMLKAASEKGWLDYESTLMEQLMAFKRAGCNAILTYGALDAAQIIKASKG